MNPVPRHFRKSRLAGWLAPHRKLIACVMIATGAVLAAPAHAQQAAGSTYGPVRAADTLWVLARRFRGGAQVSLQQTMIAILRANPGAFTDGNINALRSGVTLRVPSAAEIASITPDEASDEYARHYEAWQNRGRTGSAAPVPGPSPASRPVSSAAEPSAVPPASIADELREAHATVAELRERLVERDDAIENLLVQLATAHRELREARGGAPAPSGQDGEAGGRDVDSRTSWLPVSPLILGSSLVVLLVLIVVVTLLRQRREVAEPYGEEPWEEDGDGENLSDGEDGGVFRAGEEDREARYASARRTPGEERGALAAGLAAGALAAERGFARDDEAGESREDETDDLPIGMDLEGEEDDWSAPPGESMQGEPKQREPGGPFGFGRHVDVGELDEIDLELDGDPAPGSFQEIPADPGERDDPPEGIGPTGPPAPGRRE